MLFVVFHKDLLKGFAFLSALPSNLCVALDLWYMCAQSLLVYFYCCLNNFRLNCLWQMGFGFTTRGLVKG